MYGLILSQTLPNPLPDTSLIIHNQRSQVTTINADQLKAASPSNFLPSLSGRFRGLQVTNATGSFAGGTRVIIRGLRSLLNDNQPLFIVDGIPYNNYDFSNGAIGKEGYDLASMVYDLNLWDIDTVSVLTPSQSGIYGSRGSNGVISIKTKHGRYSDSFKMGVDFNSSFSFEKIATYPKVQKLYGGGGSDNFTTVSIGSIDYLVPEYDIDESWGPKYNSSISVLPWNAYDSWDTENYLKSKPWVYPDNDFTSFFRTANGYQNNIQVNASNKFQTFQVSYTNLQNSGVYPNSSQKRNNISLNSNIKYKNLANVHVGFTYIDNKTIGRPGRKLTNMWQYSQTNIDFKDLQSYINPDGSQRVWNRIAWDNPKPNYQDNPYWSTNMNVQDDYHNRYFLNTSLEVNILKWLSATGRLGVDKYDFVAKNHKAVGSSEGSQFAINEYGFKESNADLFLKANKRVLKNVFGISVLAGYSKMNNTYEINEGSTNGGLAIPNVYNLNNSIDMPSVYYYSGENKIKSFYTDMQFDYNNLFFIEIMGRKDFMGETKEMLSPFITRSVCISAIPSNFELLQKNRILSYSKVFVSFTSYIQKADDNEMFSSFGNITPSISLNNNLSDEKQNHFEIGASIFLFNNRIGFEARYFNNVNSDMTGLIPINISSGYPYKHANIATIVNKGVELAVTGSPFKTSKFEWSVVFNIATLNSKVKDLAEGIETYEIENPGWAQLIAVEGESFPMICGTDYVYDNSGNKLVDTNGEYLVSLNKPLGKVTPDFNAGISNSFIFKNFTFSFLIDIQRGGHMYYTTNRFGMYSGILEETALINGINIRESGVVLDGVYGAEVSSNYIYLDAEGNVSSVPIQNATVISARRWGQGFSHGPSIRNVFSTDYIKLREVAIAYNIPIKFTHFVKGFRVSVYGRNLALWGAATKHFDPEYMQMAGSNAQGVENGYLPSLRTFGFALNMRF